MTCQAHSWRRQTQICHTHLHPQHSSPALCTDSVTLGKSSVLSEPRDPLMANTSLPPIMSVFMSSHWQGLAAPSTQQVFHKY